MYLNKISIAFLLLSIQFPVFADVTLDEKVRENFGIASVAAVSSRQSRQWQASAQVLDASSLVGTLAEIKAAKAAAGASASELKRLEALYQAGNNAALKTVEAARAQTVVDASHVQTLQSQLLSMWGSSISRMPDAERERLSQSVLSGKLVLIRAELIENAPTTLTAQNVRLKFLSDGITVTARLLGAMPQNNGQSLGKAYLLSAPVSEQGELQPGQILSAELQDSARSLTGISVPSAAVLRWQGQQWVYIEHEAGHYQRVAITVSQWLNDAVLVSKGIKTGDKVVTVGAGLILGAELAPPETEKAKEE